MTRIADGYRHDRRFEQFIDQDGVSAFFKDRFDFAAHSAKEIAEVFGFRVDLRSALDSVERVQNDNRKYNREPTPDDLRQAAVKLIKTLADRGSVLLCLH